MHKFTQFGYFYPPESGSGGGTPDVTNLPEVPGPGEDDADILAGDDGEAEEADEEQETPPESAPPERKPGTPPKEGDEFDIDEGEPDEEEIDEATGKPKKKVAAEPDEKVPSFRAIKEKYPNFFKEFPQIRAAVAEHQQFRNVFSTVQDAQEAAEHQQNFLEVSEKLMNGDFGYLVGEMRKADPDSVSRMVRNVLPELFKLDRNLYLEVTQTPIKQFLKAAHDRAAASGNKNLVNSAKYLNQYLTGKFDEPTIDDAGPDPRDEAFNQRVQKFEQDKHREALQSASGQGSAALSDLIGKAIDPNNSLKEFTKKALIRTLIGEIDGQLSQDEAHVQRMDRLWGAAKRSSYSQGHISRIVAAYLERAKNLLPKLAQQVREEHGIQVQNNGQKPGQKQQPAITPRPNPQGQPPRQKTLRDTNPRSIDWQRTSDLDVLGGKARLRK